MANKASPKHASLVQCCTLWRRIMKLFLWPGDIAAALVGLEEGSEHRQIFRMFTNTVIWGVIGVVVAFSLSS